MVPGDRNDVGGEYPNPAGVRTAPDCCCPRADASLRPVPWRRMAWVTWRQHRLALAGVVALFGVAASTC